VARFIVIHTAPSHVTQDQAIDGARQVVASMAPGAEWLNSWWIPGQVQRLFCEWEAPDSNAVRASLEPIKDLMPIESLNEAQWIDPKWYTQAAE
jgi:hypothetical protein